MTERLKPEVVSEIIKNTSDNHYGYSTEACFLLQQCLEDGVVKYENKFQNEDKIKIFIGNIKAAGVGITLTAAEVVIMNDLSFVPADHSQGEDRAYRYGQKNSVLVYYPIFENTIEGAIYDILSRKKQIIGTVMGDIEESETDIVESILKEINNR